jgi:hypothetical protein
MLICYSLVGRISLIKSSSIILCSRYKWKGFSFRTQSKFNIKVNKYYFFFFIQFFFFSSDKNNNSLKTNDNDIRENYFTNIAGVMAASDQEHFSRTLFRATRGNAFCYFELLNDSNSTLQNKETDQKTIFVTYFQGSVTGESALREKIIQLCNAFYVRFYEWPKSYEEAETRITQLNDIIADKTKALEAYEDFFLNEVIALLEVHRVSFNILYY